MSVFVCEYSLFIDLVDRLVRFVSSFERILPPFATLQGELVFPFWAPAVRTFSGNQRNHFRSHARDAGIGFFWDQLRPQTGAHVKGWAGRVANQAKRRRNKLWKDRRNRWQFSKLHGVDGTKTGGSSFRGFYLHPNGFPFGQFAVAAVA